MLQQRSSLPRADWGGRCIGQAAANYLPAASSQGQPLLHNPKAGSAYNQAPPPPDLPLISP